MKKVLNIIFALMLGLSMVACDSMLKESLTAGSGWGDVILNEANVNMGSSLSVTAGALDFTKAVVTVGGKTGTTGTVIKNVQSGTKSLTISIPAKDGKTIYTGTGSVAVKANEIVTATATLDTAVAAVNSYKFIFDPAAYGVTVVNEVHLVGNITDPQWTPADKSYALTKQSDGKWVGIFNIPAGKEFKFMYDSTSWDDGHDIGNSGANFSVSNITGVIESVLAWKVTFNPVTYGVTVVNEVHLVGNITNPQWTPADKSYSLIKQSNNTWVGYFDVAQGKEFKFMYDSTSWDDGHDIGINGSNISVGEITGVLTQIF